MKAYSLAPGWKIFFYIFSILIMGGGAAGFVYVFSEGNDSTAITLVSIFSGLAVIAGVWIILKTYMGKVIHGEDFIRTETLFVKKELLFNQIKGYTVDEHYLHLIPNAEGLKKLKIALSYNGTHELQAWARKRYRNLIVSKSEAEETLKEVMSDERYGTQRNERKNHLKKARWDARMVTIISFIISGCIFITPVALYAAILAMIIPWVAIALTYYYKGLITIYTYKENPLPSIFLAIVVPGFILLIDGSRGIHLADTTHVWLPVIAITLLMGSFIIATVKHGMLMANRASAWAGTLLYLFLVPTYSYGVVITLNTSFDNSQALYYETHVTNKRTTSGRSSSHYLQLEPWGPVHRIEELKVHSSFYQRTPVSGRVGIYLKKGWLDIPWFIVADAQ
ncbi:hypothetical protein PV783_32145 [Chitinophaga sp. CC14]|uniref:hypothetical protein n=1 Tax=Chitinophaga sp. CC14 TaxID=3029199 RepID=UPI003B81D9FB